MTMVTLSADYCGTLNLQQPFFATDLSYFANVLSFCMKMPDVTHPTGQLFMAVHLIGFGSVSILCLLFYLSLNPWEPPDWQVIAVDAAVKQVIICWLQTLDKCLYPWYRWGANAEMIMVNTLRSDVYHLLHMCHVLIRVTITFWHESVCYLIFWKFFIYTHCSVSRWVLNHWVFWMVGICVICW